MYNTVRVPQTRSKAAYTATNPSRETLNSLVLPPCMYQLSMATDKDYEYERPTGQLT